MRAGFIHLPAPPLTEAIVPVPMMPHRIVLSGLPSAPAASVGPVDMAMDETSGRRPYCRGPPPSEVAAETPRGRSASDERDAASAESIVKMAGARRVGVIKGRSRPASSRASQHLHA